MVTSFLQSESTIKDVVGLKKTELLTTVEEMYTTYKSILQDYCKIIGPIKKCITQLEVGFYHFIYLIYFQGEKYVTISQYLPLFSSLRKFWTQLRDSADSSDILKSLVLAGEEVMARKMSKWNEKIIYSAAYLDPKMRHQMEVLKDLQGVDTSKVGFN